MRSRARRSSTRGKQPCERWCPKRSGGPTGLFDRVRPLRVQVRNLLLCRLRQLRQTQSSKKRMKLLITSTDLDDLGRIVKRLVCARIPCAVCKDPGSSRLSVWIQRDIDFPLALRVVVNREERPRLPHWARALESALTVTKRSALPATNGIEPPRELLVQSKTPTWTGTAYATTLRCVAQPTRPVRPASWPLPSAYTASDSTVDDVELACAANRACPPWRSSIAGGATPHRTHPRPRGFPGAAFRTSACETILPCPDCGKSSWE